MTRYAIVFLFNLMFAVSAFAYNSSKDYGDHQNITKFAVEKLTYGNDEIQAKLQAKLGVINSVNPAEDVWYNLAHISTILQQYISVAVMIGQQVYISLPVRFQMQKTTQ